MGPTASGKSALALEVARRRRPAELLSMDAMAVYRGMDVGTASPTAAELAGLECGGMDLVDPGEDFSVGAYQAAVRPLLAGADQRGVAVVAVGGTGLYVRAVVDDLAIPGRFPEMRATWRPSPTPPSSTNGCGSSTPSPPSGPGPGTGGGSSVPSR